MKGSSKLARNSTDLVACRTAEFCEMIPKLRTTGNETHNFDGTTKEQQTSMMINKTTNIITRTLVQFKKKNLCCDHHMGTAGHQRSEREVKFMHTLMKRPPRALLLAQQGFEFGIKFNCQIVQKILTYYQAYFSLINIPI